MTRLASLLVLVLLLPACVATSSDLRDLAAMLRAEVADKTDPRDVRERIADAIEAKADAIETRAVEAAKVAADAVVPGLGEIIGAAAAVTAAGGVALNAHRNSTRRKGGSA